MIEFTKNTISHVHTAACKHASLAPEDAILKALELGADKIIFNEHMPYSGDPFRCRMKYHELVSEYLTPLQMLKEKYKERIEVVVGFEAEFITRYCDYYKGFLDQGMAESLIIGQHFSELPNGSYTFGLKDRTEEYKYLAESMIQGMETGLFDVVAHPERIFRKKKIWDKECEEISNQIKQCAIRTDTKLEINLGSMLDKDNSYRPEFWNNMPIGADIIYGTDAHSLDELIWAHDLQLKLQAQSGD